MDLPVWRGLPFGGAETLGWTLFALATLAALTESGREALERAAELRGWRLSVAAGALALTFAAGAGLLTSLPATLSLLAWAALPTLLLDYFDPDDRSPAAVQMEFAAAFAIWTPVVFRALDRIAEPSEAASRWFAAVAAILSVLLFVGHRRLPGSKFMLPEQTPFGVRVGLGALFFGSFAWALWLLLVRFLPPAVAEFSSVGEYAFTLLFWATVGVVWVFVTQSLLANLLRQLQGEGFASELPAAAAAGAFSALYFLDTLHWLVVGAAAILSYGVSVGFQRSRTATAPAFWAFAAPASAWIALHLGAQIFDSFYRDLAAGAGL